MMGHDERATRPFKAFPRDPLSISASIPISDSFMDSSENYHVFRKQMLDQICASNGGQPTITNPRMRRTSNKSLNDSNESNQHENDFHHQQQQQRIDAHNQTNSDSSSNSGNGTINGPIKDNAYYERRRKNNAAAKKSRDRRRIKEDEINIRVSFLERENYRLKVELNATKQQLSKYVPT